MQIQNGILSSVAQTYTRQVGAPATRSGPSVAGSLRTPAGRPRTDSVALSDTTRELMRMRDAATAAPEMRADRVAQLKAMIATGGYHIEPTALAATMLR